MDEHKGMLLDTSAMLMKTVFFEEDFGLEDMYNHVGCDHLDIVRLPERIDIWVDDEGLLKSGNIVMQYQLKDIGEPLHLAGNALFLSYDDEGNTIGLTNDQIMWIAENIEFVPYGETR